MEWQNIETAPKDGTNVILLVGGETHLGFYQDFEIRKYGQTQSHAKGWRRSGAFCDEVHPTQWLPLPAAPGQ